jgi:predicted metal-binding membrane protein
MTGARTAGTASVPTAVLAVATAAWVVTAQQMQGMDMGVATELGSFRFFVVAWVSMTAAMMLPGALPALARRARSRRPVLAVPLFTVTYMAVWTLVGLVVYVLYRPHGTAAAGALTVAAGLYELTPLKRACRRRCRENVRSGSWFGLCCVGSSIGLMLVLLAVGAMSIGWMCATAVVVIAEKLVPPRLWLDVPLGVAVVGLGIAVVAAPASIPGIAPPM